QLFIGLAVSSHNPAQGCSAQIDNVSLRAGLSLPTPLIGSGDGIQGTYLDLLTHTNLIRVDPAVDFDWGPGSPATGIGTDFFTVRWLAVVEAQFSETYAFHLI